MGPDWEQAVGKFILALGDIEHTTILFFNTLPDCNIPKTAPKLQLGSRLEIIREVLERYSDGEYREALSAIESVERLISSRNLVAHNGVSLDVYSDGQRIAFTSQLTSSRNKKTKLNLEQMQGLAKEAESVAWTLSGTWVELAKFIDPTLDETASFE